jgi:hypothetical protein
MPSVEPRYPEWEPEPLQLPLSDEDQRVERGDDDDKAEPERRVIVIDLV